MNENIVAYAICALAFLGVCCQFAMNAAQGKINEIVKERIDALEERNRQ